MDLSSSATQRNSTSEALSIQPGSVRVTTAVAANEFARHLAENAKSDASRRRDERGTERAERTPDRPREAREDKTESRKAGEEREAAKDEAARPQTAETATMLPLIDETATEEKSGDMPDMGSVAEEAAAETPASAAGQTAETETPETANTATTDTESAEAPATEATQADSTTPEAAIRDEAAPETSETGIAKPETANPVAIAAQTAAPDAAQTEVKITGEASPEKPRSQINAERPLETASTSGDAETAMPEAKPAEETKPAKGLGQEAAEQLAGKKADAKQAGELPKATLQAVQQMAQQILRAAAPQAQGTPLMTASSETNGALRAINMPASALPQSTQANGASATVRIGTLPGQSQPTQVPAAAIALQMARNLQKGISRFDIRLDPPEMGRIDVRMEIRKDGQVVAHMSVERPETLDLLQRDARALQQALNNAGLQADSDSLNFSLKDGQDDSSNPSFAGNGNGAGGSDTDDDAPILPVYNVNLAADGGVDIRV